MRTVLPDDDPRASVLRDAIQHGEVERLEAILEADPQLATTWLASTSGRGEEARSLLHVVSDWPGHFPRGADTVAVLVRAGADVNAPFSGAHAETPLHWAASSDDVAVLDALLDAGADIEARGAVIAATHLVAWLESGAETTPP